MTRKTANVFFMPMQKRVNLVAVETCCNMIFKLAFNSCTIWRRYNWEWINQRSFYLTLGGPPGGEAQKHWLGTNPYSYSYSATILVQVRLWRSTDRRWLAATTVPGRLSSPKSSPCDYGTRLNLVWLWVRTDFCLAFWPKSKSWQYFFAIFFRLAAFRSIFWIILTCWDPLHSDMEMVEMDMELNRV